MWSVVLIPRLQITVSAWRLLLLMRMALCWTATRELTIYSFTYLTVLSVTLAQRTGGVNLAGILGGRRGGSRRLGTPPHREGSGYGLGPSPEKKISLEISCFGAFWALFLSVSSPKKCWIFRLKCFSVASKRAVENVFLLWIFSTADRNLRGGPTNLDPERSRRTPCKMCWSNPATHTHTHTHSR